jgi:hypothetical protein
MTNDARETFSSSRLMDGDFDSLILENEIQVMRGMCSGMMMVVMDLKR